MRAFELAALAVEQARASGDDLLVDRALRQYTHRAIVLHRLDDAKQAYSEVEAMPDTAVSNGLFPLGARAAIDWYRGDLEAAFRIFEQLRKEYRSLGDAHGEQTTAVNLAEIAYARGQTNVAVTLIREILPGVRAGGDKTLPVNLLVDLARSLAAEDNLPGAIAAAREAVRIRSAVDPEHAACIPRNKRVVAEEHKMPGRR
jgi:ATP/maltotriose-dependent transcriptional regulator MalT